MLSFLTHQFLGMNYQTIMSDVLLTKPCHERKQEASDFFMLFKQKSIRKGSSWKFSDVEHRHVNLSRRLPINQASHFVSITQNITDTFNWWLYLYLILI